MIWGYWALFLQISLMHETGIIEASDDLGIKVKSHLMLNKALKILDYFSCVPVYDLGYLGQVSPNCPNIQVPMKQV